MNELTKFLMPESGILIRVSGTPERPLFVAKDVCDVLGIVNSRDALESLDVDEKADVAISDTSSNGVTQDRVFNTVTESGLYALVFRSRKPEAKAFRKWVTSEVLPMIRKTGGYAANPAMKNVADGVDLIVSAVNRLIAMGVPPEAAMKMTEMGEHFLSNVYKEQGRESPSSLQVKASKRPYAKGKA